MRPFLASSLVLLAAHATLAAPPAPTGRRSEEARTTIVVDLSADERENAEILREVRTAVATHVDRRGDLDFTLVDVNGPLNAGGEARDRTNIATAQGFAQAGKASAAKQEWTEAADQLDSARKLYEESLAVADDPRGAFAPLVIALGEALLMSGDAAAAREVFLQAASWDASGAGLGARGASAYAAAKAEASGLAKGKLQMNTTPPYAEVFVDGAFRGVSPLRLDVPVGVHIATISKAGYERATVRLEVRSDQTAHRDVALVPARKKVFYDGTKPKLVKDVVAATTPGSVRWGRGGDGIVELGNLFRSEVAVIAKVSGPPELKKLEVHVFHVPSQRLVGTTVTDRLDWGFNNVAAVRATVDAALDIDWVKELGGEVAGPSAASDESITSKWWFWTLIGVAVAGGTTAVVLATQDGESPSPFTRTPGTGAVVIGF